MNSEHISIVRAPAARHASSPAIPRVKPVPAPFWSVSISDPRDPRGGPLKQLEANIRSLVATKVVPDDASRFIDQCLSLAERCNGEDIGKWAVTREPAGSRIGPDEKFAASLWILEFQKQRDAAAGTA